MMYTHQAAEPSLVPIVVKIAEAMDMVLVAQEETSKIIDLLCNSFYLVYAILFVLCLCVLYMAVKLRKHL